MVEYYERQTEPTHVAKPTINDKMDAILERLDEKEKTKKFKLPWTARLGKKKIRDGWVIVQLWNDNKSVDFKKVQIIDGTYKLGDTFHTLSANDILLYKGRWPMVVQPKRKINPINILAEKHETRGHKYIIARMEGDKILSKKQMGWGVAIIGLLVAVGIGYYLFVGG